VPTSSAILIFGIQTSENASTLSLSDTIDFVSVSDDDLHIALRKSKHTYTSHLISYFISYS